MIIEQCQILKNIKLNHKYHHLILQSESISSEIKEGQFLNLQCSDEKELLKRPFSIYRFDREKETIEIVYVMKGKGTRLLSDKLPGDFIEVLGPLGNNYKINSNEKPIIIIGRGVGAASVISVGESARKMDKEVIAILSAKKNGDTLGGDFLTKIGCKVYYLYDDIGTSCMENMTDLLEQIIESENPDQIFTCGSNRIGKTVGDIKSKHKEIEAYISLEEKMACGIGTCLVCVCKTKSGHKTVCKEGPVFPVNEVIFSE